jgi:glycosyltransferase involved in cell wall biosynthesis
MKLLIYSHAFAPQIGGAETYAMNLARGLSAREKGNSVHVTVVTQAPKKDYDDTALPFAVVRSPGIFHLLKLIRQSDVVHLSGPAMAPLLLALIVRKPVVVEHNGYQASCPNGLLLYQPTNTACPNHYMRHEYLDCLRCNASESGWFASVRMLLLTGPRRWLSRRANVNLAITQHVAGRLELPRTSIVYHGVPSAHGDPASADAASASRSLTIAFVGRLVIEKDVPTIIEAVRLAQMAGYRVALKIIGDGPERAHVESAISADAFDPPVIMTGYLQNEPLRKALRDVAVVVIPTIMEETAGLAAMEQMMRGRPVIVSDIGGLAEVAGDGGLKFPPKNAVALSACLRQLIDDPELLRELGTRAQNRASKVFSLDRMIEEHYQLFQNVISGAAR